MRIAVVNSSELLSKPWGAIHHLPGVVSAEAQRLVVAYKRAKEAHEQSPDEGSKALLEIVTELAAKRARSNQRNNHAERASVKADTELFVSVGIPLDR